MIVICDKAQNVVVPAGLGDNPGVVYEISGVKSLNGETGDVKIKTVNGQSLMGEGDVPVDVGVETLNGQKGALTLKTVNGNELTGDGNIEIQAGLKYFELSKASRKEAYDEIANHWDDNSGYTGDCIFYYRRERGVYTFSEIGYLKDHSVWFNYLNNAGAYDLNGGVKGFVIIIWYNAGDPSFSTYEQDYTIPKNISQLTNDSGFQTKAEVDTAINNALSGGGSGEQNVIVLDGLSQEERKAIYDKLDRTKPIKQIFKYYGDTSFHYAIQGDWIKIYFLSCSVYNAGEIRGYILMSDGSLEQFNTGMNYPNFLFFNVYNHTDEGADFECEYTGDFHYFLKSTWTNPNGYFLVLKKGIGDSIKFMVLPLTVLCDKEPDTSNIPIRIQFTANEKLYTYLHGDADGKWLFESAKPIGGVQSSEVSNIKVLTQSEYDTLTPKDENVLYCIKG